MHIIELYEKYQSHATVGLCGCCILDIAEWWHTSWPNQCYCILEPE